MIDDKKSQGDSENPTCKHHEEEYGFFDEKVSDDVIEVILVDLIGDWVFQHRCVELHF